MSEVTMRYAMCLGFQLINDGPHTEFVISSCLYEGRDRDQTFCLIPIMIAHKGKEDGSCFAPCFLIPCLPH